MSNYKLRLVQVKRTRRNKMSCYINDQVSNHCNADESFCIDCGGNMYFDDFDVTLLVCESCSNEIDTSRDE